MQVPYRHGKQHSKWGDVHLLYKMKQLWNIIVAGVFCHSYCCLERWVVFYMFVACDIQSYSEFESVVGPEAYSNLTNGLRLTANIQMWEE